MQNKMHTIIRFLVTHITYNIVRPGTEGGPHRHTPRAASFRGGIFQGRYFSESVTKFILRFHNPLVINIVKHKFL